MLFVFPAGQRPGVCNFPAALNGSLCVCVRGLADAMRQLKGKPKKESWKDKKERKQAMQEAREQVTTVVLPTLAVLILLIVLFVYVATRPGAVQ